MQDIGREIPPFRVPCGGPRRSVRISPPAVTQVETELSSFIGPVYGAKVATWFASWAEVPRGLLGGGVVQVQDMQGTSRPLKETYGNIE